MKTYVIGDIHGDYGRLVSLLQSLGVLSWKFIDGILEPIWTGNDAIVIQLGDQIDAVPRSDREWMPTVSDLDVIRFTDKIQTLAKQYGGDFVSIIGNHEWANMIHQDFSYVHPIDKNQSRKSFLEPRIGEIALMLGKRPLYYFHKGFLFTHAGVLLRHMNLINLLQICWKNYCIHGIEFPKNIIHVGEDLVWNRYYTTLPPQEIIQNVNGIIKKYSDLGLVNAIFVGHTVVENIVSIANLVYFVDTGISRSFGGSNQKEIVSIDDDGTISKKIVMFKN